MAVRVAIAIAFLIAIAARADPVPDIAPPSAEPSAMQVGRMLIRAGRLRHARVFLEQARPADEDEWVERLFLLGQIELRLDMPRRAAERFETILARRPDLTRVQLELARAYFMAGRDDEAESHFRASMAQSLPSSVESAVEDFLRSIDARKRWSVSFAASMLPETKRSNRETVLIGGVPFRLDEDARASSGVGRLMSAGVSFSPTIAEDLRGVLALSAAAKRYKRSAWDDTTASGDIGVTRLFDAGSVSGGMRIGRRWLAGDPYYRSLGPWAQIHLRLSRVTHVGMALSAGYRTHDKRRSRDGRRIVASPRVLHLLNERTSIEVEPTVELVEAKTERHGSRLVGLRATLARAFDGGLSISVSPSADFRRHSARDPLFGKTRADRNLRLGVRVSHRSLRYHGIAPYIGYSAERNRSNIPIHESRSQGVYAGVSRRF